MVFGHLHWTLQPAAQTVWASIQRSLQGADRGRKRQRLLEGGVRLCASESGAGEVVALEAGVAGISLEQLAGVFAASRPTLAVAADRSVAGRVSDSQGQLGRAAGIGEGAGGTARGGGGSGLQEAATRLVFGGGDVPEGVVGADEEANASRTLWGGAGRDDGDARRRDCGGRNETASVERKGVGTPSQR